MTEWGWYKPDKSATGPFPTRDAAIANARAYYGDEPTTVLVGTLTYVDPTDWIGVDVDDLLERADLHFGDTVSVDDEIFVVAENDKKAAMAELQQFFKAWSRRWVRSEMCWYVEDGDEIELPEVQA